MLQDRKAQFYLCALHFKYKSNMPIFISTRKPAGVNQCCELKPVEQCQEVLLYFFLFVLCLALLCLSLNVPELSTTSPECGKC